MLDIGNTVHNRGFTCPCCSRGVCDRGIKNELVNAEIVDVDSGIKEAKAWLKEKHHDSVQG